MNKDILERMKTYAYLDGSGSNEDEGNSEKENRLYRDMTTAFVQPIEEKLGEINQAFKEELRLNYFFTLEGQVGMTFYDPQYTDVMIDADYTVDKAVQKIVHAKNLELMAAIADRATEMNALMFDRTSLMMDLDAANDEFNLRLGAFLEADSFNFLHDIYGIQRHLNRSERKMAGFFVPRFAGLTAEVKANA